MDAPVLKMTASLRRSFWVPARPYPRSTHAVGDAELERIYTMPARRPARIVVALSSAHVCARNEAWSVHGPMHIPCAYVHLRMASVSPADQAKRYAITTYRLRRRHVYCRGHGRAGTQNDRLTEAVILSTGTPMPAQLKCRRRCRCRADMVPGASVSPPCAGEGPWLVGIGGADHHNAADACLTRLVRSRVGVWRVCTRAYMDGRQGLQPRRHTHV